MNEPSRPGAAAGGAPLRRIAAIGGGNTPGMRAVWRDAGFDRALRAAYEAGTVLAGTFGAHRCCGAAAPGRPLPQRRCRARCHE